MDGGGLTAGYELANQDRLPVPVIRVGRHFGASSFRAAHMTRY